MNKKKLISSGKHNIQKMDKKHLNHNLRFISENYSKFFKNKSSNILELGFGNNAYLLRFLSNNGFENLTGVDLDQNCINSASDIKNAHLIHDDIISFLKNNINKYDIIIMKHVLEHFKKEEVNEIVDLIHDSLKKNGFCLIEVPNIINSLGLKTYLLDFTHDSPFSPRALKQCFGNFSIKKIHSINYPMINYGSFTFFIGSVISKIISLFISLNTFLILRPFGTRGPYSQNIFGYFKK